MANDPGLTALSGAVICLDLDGTLVDTAPDLAAALNHLLVEEGLRPIPVDKARGLIGHGARRMVERGFARAGAPLDGEQLAARFDRFLVRYSAHIADQSRPYPGAVEALTAMRSAGAKLAVCTNKLTALSSALLDALDLSRFFEAIVGPDAARAAKPDPRHLQAAVQAAGGTLDRAVMVGDAATDAGAARAAAIPLILVRFGYSETPAAELAPDVLIDRLDELPHACARLLSACSR